MDTNLYALEKHVQSKLADARAACLRAALISSMRENRVAHVSVLAKLATMWVGRRRLLRRASAAASRA